MKFHGKYVDINDNCLFLRGLRSIIEETSNLSVSSYYVRIRTVAYVTMVSLLPHSLCLEYFKLPYFMNNDHVINRSVDKNIVFMFLNVPSGLRYI